MPQKFSKLFKVGKIRAHVIRRKDGLYLIRCQIDKVRISVAASQLDYCKERFIEKLHEKFEIITLNGEKKGKKGLTPLVPYMEAWIESTKKPFIKENTYIDYVRMMKAYILPVFKGKYIEVFALWNCKAFSPISRIVAERAPLKRFTSYSRRCLTLQSPTGSLR